MQRKENNMKKLLAILLASVLTFSVASCGKDEEDTKANAENDSKASDTVKDDEEDNKKNDEEDEENGKKNDKEDEEDDDKKKDEDKTSEAKDKDKVTKDDEEIEKPEEPEEYPEDAKEYFDKVMDVEGTAEVIGEAFADYEYSTVGTVTADMTITPGKGMASFLAEIVGNDVDEIYKEYVSEWLENANIDLTASVDGPEHMQVVATVGINDTDIANLDVIVDIEGEAVYITIPELSNKSLAVEIPEDFISTFSTQMALNAELAEILPSGDTMEKIAAKYLGIIVDAITDVEKYEDKIIVNSVKQDVTALSFDIDGEMVQEVGIELLETLKKDKDVRTFLESYLGLMGMPSDSIDNFYDNIDTSIQDLEDLDTSEMNTVNVVFYFNDDHEFTGVTMAPEEEEGNLLFLIAQSKGKFGMEFILNDVTYLLGEGTVTDDGAVSGTVNLYIDEGNAIDIELEDVMINDDEKLLGTIAVTSPTYTFNEFDFALEFKDETVALTVNYAGKKVATLEIEYTESEEADDIVAPSGRNVVAVTDDPTPYMSTISFDKILSNMEKAGVSDEVISLIESLLEQAGL